MSNLVIVESPAKAKTIKKYLGDQYEVVASLGHVRDLPESRLSVDVKNNFKPKYEIIKGKEKVAKDLLNQAKKSDRVFLATDPDREGEAIAWHLAYILGVDEEEKNRVTFNEITKSGVANGMSNPRKIDIDLVDAQQARRVLDRLVGYKLSPFLCTKIRKGLSAGRVQSVALKIVCDREDEISKFKPQEYWSIDAKFSPEKKRQVFPAAIVFYKGKKIAIKSKSEADKVLKDLETCEYKVANVKKSVRKKTPPPPFITSTLQQEASRKLGFQAKRTMRVAQQLYEGIEIGDEGASGLITYMRTDSLRLSQEATKDAANYIKEKYGEKYLPSKARVFKSKSGAQDAHEAIRPTMPRKTPEDLKRYLTQEQYKLYKLIWERFIACQMASCIQDTTSVDIEGNDYTFRASGYIVSFDGYTVLYEEGKDEKEEKLGVLPELKKDMVLKLKDLVSNQHFTQPPARFTEASLIKALESYGIGRPSTYASILTTLSTRGYVERENKSLIPTELGQVITKLLEDKFPNIVNVKFTADMETNLDIIEEGKCKWTDVIKDFYQDFYDTLKRVKEEMKDVKIRLEDEKTDIICEKCGRTMVIKTGRYGKFIACPGYPECKNIKKIINEIGVDCPKCGGKVVERRSKKGRIFYGCANYPNCDFVSWEKPIDERCPKCGKLLYLRKGKIPKSFCKDEECGYISDRES